MVARTRKRLLNLDDLRACDTPAKLLDLFRRLGYHTESSLGPISPATLELSASNTEQVEVAYLIADYPHPTAGLQLLLVHLHPQAELRSATVRAIAQDFVRKHAGNYLLIFTKGYQQIIFVNARRLAVEARNATLAVRIKLHKLVVERTAPTRHDLDILESLQCASPAATAAEIYALHCKAFDVEKVTEQFYTRYAVLFKAARDNIKAWNRGVQRFTDPRQLHAFTQRLFGRLMFLYFLQKKGWLAERSSFLTYHYQQTVQNGGNFFQEVLEPLFFDTLNRRRPQDASPFGNIPYLNGGLFERDYQEVLFLDNALFDPTHSDGLLSFFDNYNFTIEEDTPFEVEVALDPEMLGKVFENLLEEEERGKSGTYYTPRPIVHYMCRESVLLYLLHESGLPRAELEALLDEQSDPPQVSSRQIERIERLLQDIRVLDPAVGSGAFLVGMLQELVQVRRQLHRAQGVPVPRETGLNAHWKEQIIRDCLYGVDLKPEAVEIAKLRLWLSLVVDLGRDQVSPLPNLDYKLMAGNSLIESIDGRPFMNPSALRLEVSGTPPTQGVLSPPQAPLAQSQMFSAVDSRAVERLADLQATFFTAAPEERRDLRWEIQQQEADLFAGYIRTRLANLESKRADLTKRLDQAKWALTSNRRAEGFIKEYTQQTEEIATQAARLEDILTSIHAGNALPFFLYRLHFAEVFSNRGGFDIVIANPPYVRQEKITEQKDAFRVAYPDVYHGVADLYIYFYARGFQLLRSGGILVYIAPNKFFRAAYGEKLRTFLSSKATLETLIDFRDYPVFSATTYPCILIARNTLPPKSHQLHQMSVAPTVQLDQIDTWARTAALFPQQQLGKEGWSFESDVLAGILAKVKAAGVPLETYVGGKIYYGIKTGLNEAFVIDAATRERLIAEDPASAEIIKPFLRGRDIKRYQVAPKELYLIKAYMGIVITHYPAILKHLSTYQQDLENRYEVKRGQFKWYELRPCDYYEEFEKPKIVYPVIASRPTFAFDRQGYYSNDKSFIIPTTELWLLCLLDSRLADLFFTKVCAEIRGGFIEFRSTYVGTVGIPSIEPTIKTQLEELVKNLIQHENKGEQAEAWQREIDALVYQLYGLNEAEVIVVEEWYERRHTEKREREVEE